MDQPGNRATDLRHRAGRDPRPGPERSHGKGSKRKKEGEGCLACLQAADGHTRPGVLETNQGGTKMANQKIRIKLKAYEHNLIDQSDRKSTRLNSSHIL